MINYFKAKRYARKCGYGDDLVHDAYVTWFNKTGNNLFLEPEYRVMAVMGWTVRKERGKNTQMWRGEKYQRRYITLSADTYRGDEYEPDNLIPNEPNQERYCSYKEITSRLEALEGFSRLVYSYLKNGYSITEIAKAENVSIQKVFHHVKKIRYIGGSNHYIKHPNGSYYERNFLTTSPINPGNMGAI